MKCCGEIYQQLLVMIGRIRSTFVLLTLVCPLIFIEIKHHTIILKKHLQHCGLISNRNNAILHIFCPKFRFVFLNLECAPVSGEAGAPHFAGHPLYLYMIHHSETYSFSLL